MKKSDFREDPAIWMVALKATGLACLVMAVLLLVHPFPFGRVPSLLSLFFLSAPFFIVARVVAAVLYNLDAVTAIVRWQKTQAENEKNQIQARRENLLNKKSGTFDGLDLGYSTGLLDSRACTAGIQRGQLVHLPPANCCQNIFIMGGIGSGKTVSLINPLLLQILRSDASALIFDIKGDFRREVEAVSMLAKRNYKIVGFGEGALTINLFRGANPELASSYLRSCFVARGAASGDGAFWVDTAVNYCRNLLYLIQLGDGNYSIAGLAAVAFSASKRDELIEACLKKAEDRAFQNEETLIWDVVFDYFQNSVEKWDDKLRSNIQATLESVLNPFVLPALVKAFSSGSEEGEANFDELLNDPSIFLVQLPQSFGDGARWAYLIIKLRFFTLMRERRQRSDVNQDRYVSYFCDEYQKIVDAVSDIDFWDKSRSSKCFGVVTMQGYASLVQSVGSEKAAEAISQNWRQKIMLLTEDHSTIEKMQKLIGKGDAQLHSTSESSSKSTSSNSKSDGKSKNTADSTSRSVSIQRREYFDWSDARSLGNNALLVSTVGMEARCDVIETTALIV